MNFSKLFLKLLELPAARPLIIGVSAGPCAGKSDLLREILAMFGWKVVIVPEVATMLFTGGFPVPSTSWSKAKKAEWAETFQTVVLPNQLGLEKSMVRKAIEDGAKVVICDRGVPDIWAYWPYGKEHFFRHFDLSPEIFFTRYDHVFMLESTAFDPSLYNRLRHSNPSRKETAKQAWERQILTENAWDGHPNLRKVSGRDGFKYVVDEVSSFISDLVDTEIERKWRLPGMPDIRSGKPRRIVQGYLQTDGTYERRVRDDAQIYYETIKSLEIHQRREHERLIPKYIFDLYWREIWGWTGKHRTLISVDANRFEIDQFFHSKKGDIVLMELEATNVAQSLDVELPHWAKGAIEVTEDPEYKNVNMAF